MNALTLRALALLPSAERAKIRAHKYLDELEDLVQNAWIELLEMESGDTMRSLADRARSDSRRFTQDPAHYSRPLDGIADVAVDKQPTRARKKKEIVLEITADFKVGKRRGRQIVDRQIDRARLGDLFADDGSDGDDDGEEE